ncbi:MAG: hypothetical protein ACE149_04755 [Armatimonadota bacterium]
MADRTRTEPAPGPGLLDDGAWFHGSPEALTELAIGSTITRSRVAAEAFAHKPTCVGVEEKAPLLRVCHNGAQAGFLYLVEEVAPDDVRPHPDSSFPGGGLEWLTNRPLKVRKIADLPAGGPPCLGEDCPHRRERER